MEDDQYQNMIHDDIDEGCEIDVDAMLDEVFCTRLRVVALEKENAELMQKIASLQKWKDEIENVMMTDTMSINTEKKQKQKRVKTDEQQKFDMFCQLHKGDSKIQQTALSKVVSLGYTHVKKAPWSVVRLELQTMYNNLSEQEKSNILLKQVSDCQ